MRTDLFNGICKNSEKRKIERKERESFKSYCKANLVNSPLTGISPIIESKGCFYKSVRIFILAFSIAGFLFQTFQFLQLYWEYSTVESVTSLDTMIRPAITICDANLVRRPFLCKELPKLCPEPQDNSYDYYPLYCEYKNETTGRESIPDLQIYPDKFFDMNFTKVGGFRIKDRIQFCGLRGDKSNDGNLDTPCGTAKFIRSLNKEKVPAACYALYSKTGERNSTLRMFHLDEVYLLDLDFEIKDSVNPNIKPHYYLSFHHPFGISNPFHEGIALEEGFMYKVKVHQESVVRLSAPYATDCHDYLKDWYENGGYGPLRKTECQEICEIEGQSGTNECVYKEVVYPHEKEICKHYYFDYSLTSRIRKCYEKCKESCLEVKYKYEANVLQQVYEINGEDKYGSKCSVAMEIRFNLLESHQILHRPKYESVELFSYIGGYMGMWLGWSLVAIFDFFGTIIRICKYPLMLKMKKGRTDTVKSLENNQYHTY